MDRQIKRLSASALASARRATQTPRPLSPASGAPPRCTESADRPWWTSPGAPPIGPQDRGLMEYYAGLGADAAGSREPRVVEISEEEAALKRSLGAAAARELRRSLKAKGITRWEPERKLPRDAMTRIKELSKAVDDSGQLRFSKSQLARAYGVSQEAIRRIIRSRYVPNEDLKRQK